MIALIGCDARHYATFADSRRTPATTPVAAADTRDSDPWVAEQRRAAHERDRFEHPGARPTDNLALDEATTGWPAADSDPARSPALAVDGDEATGWRGQGAGPWRWSLPFRRVVHLSLVRVLLGDSARRGVPAAFHWEIQPPRGGRCEPGEPWVELPGARRDDRDGNVFVHGPPDVHAQRQALFVDADACGLRLEVEAMDDPADRPFLRELSLLEGARSLTLGASATASSHAASPAGAIDGRYEGRWAGAPGAGPWELTVRLPAPRLVDRLGLVLGEDAVTVGRPGVSRPHGRAFQGANLPTDYEVSTSYDDDPAHLAPLPEAAPPRSHGEALPVRRRLVHLATPRPVQLVRLTIRRASGPWGEGDAWLGAPVVREVSLYGADDPRPVITPPVFWSVDANPAGLTAEQPGGEAFADGMFARTLYHRLRRVLIGFDADSRWTADASRPRDAGTGRFLEVIEGDDRQLDRPLVEATSPPPVLVLSGALDWEFDQRSGRPSRPWPGHPHHWRWRADALPGDEGEEDGGGMGQLRSLVRERRAPLVGFCGGAQILALLESTAGRAPGDELTALDRVLLRNDNQPIRGLLTRREPYERAWWYDPPGLDASRPTIEFLPDDLLDDAALEPGARTTSLELPSSHGDMLRASAFAAGGPLARLDLIGWSRFCRPWVEATGPESTWSDPTDPTRRCVRVPQAFRSRPRDGYPLVGFQFHPEQRDFTRLAPGSPPEARGDALNVVANTVDLVLESYRRLYWSGA